GVVIEARVDPGLGAVCTVLVQEGTLALGEHMVAGVGYGRIRALHDTFGKQVSAAGPSTPVLVSGLSELPGAGDRFYEVDDLDEARGIAGERALIARQLDLAVKNKV